MILAFGIFSSIVTPDALLRITPKFFFNSTLLMSIALRFTPVISDDMQAIKDAQRSRGLNLSQGNLFTRLLKHKALVVPAVVSSLERSLNLAEAMASRAYNKNRTKYVLERWHTQNHITLGMLAISLAILLWSKANGLLFYWPYNSLAPPFSLIPLVAILLLIIPIRK
jgi:energy-coupling factor transporter transmembrane protein EcfT